MFNGLCIFGFLEEASWCNILFACKYFKYFNHVTSPHPLFPANQLQTFQAFVIRQILESSYQFGGSSLHLLESCKVLPHVGSDGLCTIVKVRSHIGRVQLSEIGHVQAFK